MRLAHTRLYRDRHLRREKRRQEAFAECSSAEEQGNSEQPLESNQKTTASLIIDSPSHVNYSVKMGDDYSLDISEASSIEHASTGSVFVVPELADHPPSDEEDESRRKTLPSVTEFIKTENTPNRFPHNSHKNEKYYHRKDDDVGHGVVLPSNMSYGEWKKLQLTIHSQHSSSPASSTSGSAIARVRTTVHPSHRTTPSTQIGNSSSASARYMDPRNYQESEMYHDRLPIVTPPRSVVSQASFASASSGLTARMMNTSYFPQALGRDEVLIRVGDKEFSHSRAMLCYASKVLAQHIDGGTDELHIPHKSPSEWNELQAFLQPRSIQSATITPRNLPGLLPWFDQLELTVLLRECDVLLSRLEFATAIPEEEILDSAVSHAVHELARAALGIRDSQQQHPRSAQPCYQDIMDIVLLTRISGKVCLPRTRVMCLDVLQEYLNLPYLFLQTDENKKCQAIRLITALIELLEDEEVLDTLWPLIVSYLPEDLPCRNDPRELLKNPLFPYLLRAGFDKAWHESDDFSESSLWRDHRRRVRDISAIEPASGPDPNVEVSFRGVRDVDGVAVRDDHVHGHNNNLCDDVDPMESLQYTFETYHEATSIPAKVSNARSSSFIPNDGHSNSKNREPVGLEIPPQDRSPWLHSIWRKLLEPPIFPIRSEDHPLETASSRGSDERTFSC